MKRARLPLKELLVWWKLVVFPSFVIRNTRLSWPVIAIFTWLLPLTTVFPAAEAGPAKGTAKANSAAAATEVCRVFL